MSELNKAPERNYVPEASQSKEIIPASLRIKYPEPLNFKTAFHGPLGELCRDLAQYTAADPQALYIQSLSALGVIAACPAPQEDWQYGSKYEYITASLDFFGAPRMFLMVVGETASYKGTSWDFAWRKIVSPIIAMTWPLDSFDLSFEGRWFSNDFVISGISSGEGLIKKFQKTFTVEDEDGEGDEVKITVERHDDNSPINRLVLLEEANVLLTNCKRPESITSEVVRMAFDGRPMENPSKSDAGRAPNPFCSVIAQTTPTELVNNLNVERVAGNGFINRWLFVPVYGQVIPMSKTKFDIADHAAALQKITDCIKEARKFQEAKKVINFTDEGQQRFDEIAKELNILHSGIRANASARSQVFIARLAAQMALLDPMSYETPATEIITPEHIDAAYMWVKRSNVGVGWVFGWNELTADEERVLELLDNGEQTRSAINKEALKGKLKRSQIDNIARSLIAQDLIEVRDAPPDGKRGIQWWKIKEEENSLPDSSNNSPQITTTHTNQHQEESNG